MTLFLCGLSLGVALGALGVHAADASLIARQKKTIDELIKLNRDNCNYFRKRLGGVEKGLKHAN
jgi:hypothetical protein